MFDKTFSAVCTVSKELRLPADVACDLFWWVVGSHPRAVMLSTRLTPQSISATHSLCFQLAWCRNSSALLTHRVFNSPDVSTRQRYSRVCNPWHTVPSIHRHASQPSAGSWIHLSFLHGVHSPEVLTGSTARRCESIAPRSNYIYDINRNVKY